MQYYQEVGEKLDPALKPVLLKEVIIKGGITLIRLGSTEIEYNPSFRYSDGIKSES